MNFKATDHDPDEQADIQTLIAEVVADPRRWMATPNDVLGGETPNDLIRNNPAGEQRVRELARAIKHGMPM